MQGEGKCGSDAEDSSSGPVDGLNDGFGPSWDVGELDELPLMRVRDRGFAKEGKRGAKVGQLRGAGRASGEMILQGGEVAAEGMRGAGEDHVAELLVSEMGGHRVSLSVEVWRARMMARAR